MPSRRTFLKRASGLVAAIGVPMFIPSERLGFGVPTQRLVAPEPPAFSRIIGGSVDIDVRPALAPEPPKLTLAMLRELQANVPSMLDYQQGFGVLREERRGVTLLEAALQTNNDAEEHLIKMFEGEAVAMPWTQFEESDGRETWNDVEDKPSWASIRTITRKPYVRTVYTQPDSATFAVLRGTIERSEG